MENEKFQGLVLNHLAHLTEELNSVKKTVINIENDHGEKIAALFDGFVQTNDKIDQVKAELLEQIDEVRVDTRYLISRVLGLEKLAR